MRKFLFYVCICVSLYNKPGWGLDDKPPPRLLTLDGGGIRGVIQGVFLDQLYQDTGLKPWEQFDIISGTSIGGILATGLALDKLNPTEIVPLFQNKGASIFRARWGSWGGLNPPCYYARGRRELAQEFCGDAWLDSIHLTGLMVTAYDRLHNTPYLFRSWMAQGQEQFHGKEKREFNPQEYNYRLQDVIMATSAAPVYFAPVTAKNFLDQERVFVDGGLVFNNPTLATYTASLDCGYGTRAKVLSLGTGELTNHMTVRAIDKQGLWGWIEDVMVITTSTHPVNYIAERLQVSEALGLQMERLQVSLPPELQYFDRPAIVPGLVKATEDELSKLKQTGVWQRIVEEYKEPRPGRPQM